MIIEKIHIKQFRGFKDTTIEIGSHITAIAGQNGTQKTTVLGILTQPFTISDENNPMYSEKPLCGGNYKSGFKDKFKFSDKFDKAGDHEWTLYSKKLEEPYIVHSIKRDENSIRFWKKGDRSKGSGYIQHPVIFLSLKRLLPIGEDKNIAESNELNLTEEEQKFYMQWHNKIMILGNQEITGSYIKSSHKNTLGANTDIYDWKQNSAGQDNIGKIILAILSFKRLKDNYPDDYKNGILAIDELDSTLYPASQEKMLEFLLKFASKLSIQIIFTTHSLFLLEKMHEKKKENEHLSDKLKVLFLEKKDNNIKITNNISYEGIFNRLSVSRGLSKPTKKIDVYTEDKEALIWVKGILKQNGCKKLNFIDVPFGCGNLITLAKKAPSFKFPNSIIILDGDVDSKQLCGLKNVMTLPGSERPELIFANFLESLSDNDNFWTKEDTNYYTKQVCFDKIPLNLIASDRTHAKHWFKKEMQSWGRGCSRLINRWLNDDSNKKEVEIFKKKINEICKDITNKHFN